MKTQPIITSALSLELLAMCLPTEPIEVARAHACREFNAAISFCVHSLVTQAGWAGADLLRGNTLQLLETRAVISQSPGLATPRCERLADVVLCRDSSHMSVLSVFTRYRMRSICTRMRSIYTVVHSKTFK